MCFPLNEASVGGLSYILYRCRTLSFNAVKQFPVQEITPTPPQTHTHLHTNTKLNKAVSFFEVLYYVRCIITNNISNNINMNNNRVYQYKDKHNVQSPTMERDEYCCTEEILAEKVMKNVWDFNLVIKHTVTSLHLEWNQMFIISW